jgi:hypothetical protein
MLVEPIRLLGCFRRSFIPRLEEVGGHDGGEARRVLHVIVTGRVRYTALPPTSSSTTTFTVSCCEPLCLMQTLQRVFVHDFEFNLLHLTHRYLSSACEWSVFSFAQAACNGWSNGPP